MLYTFFYERTSNERLCGVSCSIIDKVTTVHAILPILFRQNAGLLLNNQKALCKVIIAVTHNTVFNRV